MSGRTNTTMQQQIESPRPAVVHSHPFSSSDVHAGPPEVMCQSWVRRWFVAALARLRIIAGPIMLLVVLYVGSYFATAFATGTGWMEVATRQRIVWTVHWPISTCAVNEPLSGPRYINEINGWFFTAGWQWLHE